MAARRRIKANPRMFANERLELTEDEKMRLREPQTPEDQELLLCLPPIFSLRSIIDPETSLQERISHYRKLWHEHGGSELRQAPWES